MQDEEKIKYFAKSLKACFELYGQEVSKDVIKIWWGVLNKYDLEAINNAFSRHIEDTEIGQYPPKPADIIKKIEGTTKDRALVAWSKVEEAIKSVGPYQSVIFDDQYIHAAIADMGGWIKLCQCLTKELPFKAKEFEERYRGHTQKQTKEIPSKLIGIAEHENTTEGKEIAPPLLLGDPALAEDVYRIGVESKRLPIKQLQDLNIKKIGNN